MTISEIRKAMRNSTKNGRSIGETILVPGWGQIKKIGSRYAVGPLPEYDDSDIMTDYSAWSYGWREKWVLDSIKSELKLEA